MTSRGTPLRRLATIGSLGLAAAGACADPSTSSLRDLSRKLDQAPPRIARARHEGPGVAPGRTGTGRFARVVFETFREAHASEVAAAGAALDSLRQELATAGFGREEWLELEDLEASTEGRGRTLVATVLGRKAPDESVVLAARDAAGSAAMLEAALTVVALVRSEEIELPARSVVFVWGESPGPAWIGRGTGRSVAAIAICGLEEADGRADADALLERMPDPGRIDPLPPDELATGEPAESDGPEPVPDGLAVVARCATIDVGLLEPGWSTRERPYRGGGDPQAFLEHGVPAVRFAGLPDAAGTRRTASAALVAVLAVADPHPTDLQRYLESLKIEQALRYGACEAKDRDETAERWRTWCTGARLRLVELCLGREPAEDSATSPDDSETEERP